MNTKWKLDDIYKSENDPQIEIDLEKGRNDVKDFLKKWKNNKEYLVKPEVLSEALNDYENIGVAGLHGKPLYYFFLRISLDQTDKEIRAKNKLIEDDATLLDNQLSFFMLKVGKIKKSLQKEFLSHPKLQKYKHNLERTFDTAKYDLSEKEENLISLLSPNGTSNWSDMLEEFISKESVKIGEEEKTFEQLLGDLDSTDKSVRDVAGNHINNILNKWVEVAEHEVNSVLDVRKKLRKLRKVKEPDKFRHISDDMDSKTVRSMIKIVTKNFKIPARFYKLYSKLLGLKTIGYHEKSVEFGKIEKTLDFNTAFNLVLETYKKLDPELGNEVTKLQNEGRIDVYPVKGKSGGAFCVHFHPTLPIYVLLNHNDKIGDSRTLAHELGHAINNVLMFKKQPANNAHTPLSTAEVASTFFEDFALNELKSTLNDEEKFTLSIKKFQGEIGTIFRQIAIYNFELDLHNALETKGYLNKDEIGELFRENMMKYLGNSVEMSKDHNNWWIYISHIRRPFYVYTYASGLLISKALQAKVKENPKFIEKVKEFLSAGVSKSPKDIFMDLGIDISDSSFWKDGIKEMENDLNELEALAKKLGKI